MRYLVNIEIESNAVQPMFNLSDAAPEVIDKLLADALRDGAIKWASIVRIPEHVREVLQ